MWPFNNHRVQPPGHRARCYGHFRLFRWGDTDIQHLEFFNHDSIEGLRALLCLMMFLHIFTRNQVPIRMAKIRVASVSRTW